MLIYLYYFKKIDIFLTHRLLSWYIDNFFFSFFYMRKENGVAKKLVYQRYTLPPVYAIAQ